MRNRSLASAAAVVVILAACGGGSDEADGSLPVITLITTTTSLPTFDPSDSVAETEAGTQTTANEPAPGDSVDAGAQPTVPADTEPSVTPETTTEPAPPPETTTTSAPPPTAGFSLETDGLGAVSFGAAPDGVIAFVTSFLGGATADTGWVDPFAIGACGGTQLRQVTWGDLQLEFGDVSNVTEGRPHFYAYYYGKEGSSTASPTGLETSEGISVGSTVAQLLEAYPGVQLRLGDEFVNDSFFVNDNLTGRLSGLADSDLVEMVIGGIPCES